MQQRRFYIVKGKASHGLITHLCPTAAMALDTLKRFEKDAVQGICLIDPDGVAISPAHLERIVTVGIPTGPVAVTA